MTPTITPKGQLAVQTIAMPADTNPYGDIFGGWLVSQMDLAGGVIATQRSKTRVTTVAIDSMVFKHPVKVGDLVSCYGNMEKIGRTSMSIRISAWAIRQLDGSEEKVTEGLFTYVALNKSGRPTPVDKESK